MVGRCVHQKMRKEQVRSLLVGYTFDACELCIEKCAFTMNHADQVALKRVAVRDEVMNDGK